MIRLLLMAGLLAAAQPQAESAAPPSGAPLVLPFNASPPSPAPRDPMQVSNPDWIARPTGEDVVRAYPKAALNDRIGGMGVIRCAVDALGGLRDCQVVSQNPDGLGFGEAVLALAPKFRMKLFDQDGHPIPVGAKVSVPIIFSPPQR